jgi:mRNA interferase HigB
MIASLPIEEFYTAPILGARWNDSEPMRVVTKRPLREHWENPGREDSKAPLQAWYAEAQRAQWNTFADIKQKYASASSVADSLVVFNIGGNKYRLIVKINYAAGIVFVRFVGTHQEYDQVNASTL